MTRILKKLKFYAVLIFKNERFIGTVEIILFISAIIAAIFWLVYNTQELEPITIILAATGGILDVIKRIVKAPKFPKLTFSESSAQSSREASFFMGVTLTNLSEAQEASRIENKGLFLVIYDKEHPSNSKLDHSLGYFTEYDLTKRLINQYFIQAIVSSSSVEIQKYIPDNYHMENCLLVVLDEKQNILRQEEVYANSSEGLKQVRTDIQVLEQFVK